MCCGTEEDQDENDIEDSVSFSIQSLEGFAVLDGGATKTVSGFTSVQPVLDQYEDTTIEPPDVGFEFAGGETEAASVKIWIPHAKFPQGISVNRVSNGSTQFLIGLDVIREYGLVIDDHSNRVFSHMMKLCFLCAILPIRHLALEMMPGTSEWRQRPVSSHSLSTRRVRLTTEGAGEKGTPSFESCTFHLREEESEHEHTHIHT